MKRTFPWTRLPVLLLLALLLLLGWRTLQLFRAVRFIAALEEQSYEQGQLSLPRGEIESALPRLREAARLLPDAVKVRELYFETLLTAAFLEPQSSDAELHEAIRVGRTLAAAEGQDSQLRREQLAWAYYHAGLSSELTAWYRALQQQGSESSDTFYFFYLLGRASSDELDAALQQFRRGYDPTGSWWEAEAMAVSVLTALNQPAQARPYSFAAANSTFYTPQYLRGMGSYYLEQSSFESSLRYMQQYREASGNSASSAYDLALPLAQLKGLADPQVARLLDEASQSELLGMSRSGVEAQLCARLLTLTGELRWWERLLKLREVNPDDFDTALALCSAACIAAERRWGTYREPDGQPRSPGPLTLSPIATAELARELAESARQRQLAELHMALACAAECSPGNPDAVLLTRSTTHLRRALGDPRDAGSVALEGRAPCLGFLTDHHVRALRRSSRSFDSDVNRAVVDYLNQRRELFSELLQFPPLEYADSGESVAQ